jgi:hypothetical protein
MALARSPAGAGDAVLRARVLASGHRALPRSVSGDVKNRLHAVRSKSKERMLREAFHSHALPDDFANRIGPLIGVRRAVVEVLFDPNAPPDILRAYRERRSQPLRHPRAGRTTPWRRHRTRRRQVTGRRHSARATGSVPGTGSNLARICQRKFCGLSECPEPTRLMRDLQRKGANAAPRSLMSRGQATRSGVRDSTPVARHNGADEPHF